jgi:hypothetical protein
MSKDTITDIVKYRMQTLGINFGKHLKDGKKTLPHGSSSPGLLNTWDNGFRFIPIDWKALATDLHSSGRFCMETDLGQKFQKGAVAWREVERDTSMHVLYRKGEPYKGYGKSVGYYEIHIDSVPVATRGNSGKCSYDPGSLAQHAVTDLHHLPFIVPSKTAGLTFGIRF